MAAGAAALAVSQRGADYAVSPFAIAAPLPVAVVCTWHVEHFALARMYNGRYSLDVVRHAAGGVLLLAIEPRALHACPRHLQVGACFACVSTPPYECRLNEGIARQPLGQVPV